MKLAAGALVTAALLAAGCAAGGDTGGREAQAREAARGVALRESRRTDSDLYRIRLEIDEVVARIAPSGSTYWDVTLVDPGGVRRICVRVRRGGQSVGYRRCDPEGAGPPDAPASPADDADDGEVIS